MKNHPGWGKGIRIKLNDGRVVECLGDGDYREWADGTWTGWLWHYVVKNIATGDVFTRRPEIGDEPLENA